MNVEQAVCIAVGIAVQAATFLLGVFVGASMRQKESGAWRDRDRTESRRHLRR